MQTDNWMGFKNVWLGFVSWLMVNFKVLGQVLGLGVQGLKLGFSLSLQFI